MAFAALWAYLSTLAPHEATVLAAHVHGLQRYEAEALRIVKVESRGVAVGVHGDTVGRTRGYVFWRAAVKSDLVHLGECEHHVPGDDGAEGWGIRGAHGLAAAYSVYILGDCVSPAALDIPYLSAVVALKRLRILDRTHGLHTAEARALAWRIGVGAASRHATGVLVQNRAF